MGLFDYVTLNNNAFGDERGHMGQCKDLDEAPYMEKYEITPEGRLLYHEVKYEDHSDPNAKLGSIESLSGSQTPVPTGDVHDMNWHGYIWVWGKGDHKWRCKFTDGNLATAEKVEP